jgi:hypothetical protein
MFTEVGFSSFQTQIVFQEIQGDPSFGDTPNPLYPDHGRTGSLWSYDLSPGREIPEWLLTLGSVDDHGIGMADRFKQRQYRVFLAIRVYQNPFSRD